MERRKIQLAEDLDEQDLRKPEDWQKEFGIVVKDPDGWRDDGKSFDEPISRHEFEARAILSTLKRVKSAK